MRLRNGISWMTMHSRSLLKVKARLSKHESHVRRLVSDLKDSSTNAFPAISSSRISIRVRALSVS
jgi:hypothetical protein